MELLNIAKDMYTILGFNNRLSELRVDDRGYRMSFELKDCSINGMDMRRINKIIYDKYFGCIRYNISTGKDICIYIWIGSYINIEESGS